jgi:replication-associated recombination protein RarA
MSLNSMIYPSSAAESAIKMLVTPGHSFPGTIKNGIILHGPFGTGKSTCAGLLPAAIEAKYSTEAPNVRTENCMAGNNGVNLTESICKQSKGYPLSGSYIILDEVDNLTSDAMKQLKSVMNLTSSDGSFTTAFIMTTNHINRIDQGVVSRSHCIPFNPVNKDVWIPLARDLLAQYGVPNVDRISDNFIRANIIDKGNDPRSILGNSEIVAIQLIATIAQHQAQAQAPATSAP